MLVELGSDYRYVPLPSVWAADGNRCFPPSSPQRQLGASLTQKPYSLTLSSTSFPFYGIVSPYTIAFVWRPERYFRIPPRPRRGAVSPSKFFNVCLSSFFRGFSSSFLHKTEWASYLDHTITMYPADKGRCTVVLNTMDYHTKITTLLSDNNTYEALKRDPTSSYKKKVIACLQGLERDKTINRLTYHRLYPGDAIPCIYGLPKIHKEGIPLRPIVSSIKSVTYNIAKHLATILAPLVGNTPHHIKNSTDFTDKVQKLTLDPDETMVSFDVVSLFTCIPTTEVVETVRKQLQEDSTLEDRTNFTPDQICTLLDLCLTTTYFKYNEGFYRQKHDCAMGSPVSPIVANLYMEEVERKVLGSFKGRSPSHWYRYVDDTWVKIKTQEVESFTTHINAVDKNIKFTRENIKDNCLPFLDCAVHFEENGNLNIEVYRKPTHTDQYLLFDSHHSLEHKLGVIKTLHHRAEHVPSKPEGKKKERTHIKESLKTCGYPNWAFIKSAKMHRKEDQTPAREDKKDRCNNLVIPYVAGVSEKLRRVFSKHNIPVYFRPSNTLRHKLVHPKDKTAKHKLDNVVSAVQCSEGCPDLYIGETKPLHKRMAQHRRATSTGQDSAVHLHQKDKGHSFEDANVHILDREDRWFERGVKEAIYVHCEQPSLNRGGGLRHQLSPIYNPVLRSLPRCLNAHAYHGPYNLRNSHDRVGPGFTMSSPETLAE
ncbi:uncharacterized protein [Nothobranchius furzeri]|uniref:uncharacterized protein n=1 Tax=Nothobranchius furzeri TaxID=105023 RepID=UPI003904B123